MFCEKCGSKLNDGEKFCSLCGVSVSATLPLENSIQQTSLDKIANHLEFFGYETNFLEPSTKEGRITLLAKHSQRNNYVIWEIVPGIILHQVSLAANRKPSHELDNFINAANRAFNVGRLYYDIVEESAVLRFEAMYVGQYDKELYGRFFEIFENDQNTNLRSVKDFSKLFLE